MSFELPLVRSKFFLSTSISDNISFQNGTRLQAKMGDSVGGTTKKNEDFPTSDLRHDDAIFSGFPFFASTIRWRQRIEYFAQRSPVDTMSIGFVPNAEWRTWTAQIIVIARSINNFVLNHFFFFYF